MTASLNYISLKPNCTNRLFAASSFSPSPDAYLLTNFISPNFLNTLFESHNSDIMEGTSLNNFQEIINKIESDFAKLQAELGCLKSELISKACSYFSKERHFLKRQRLKEELTDLHEKVIESNFDKKKLEEFAVFYNKFKSSLEEEAKSINTSLLTKFESMTSQITRELNSALESCISQSKEDIIPVPEPIDIPIPLDVLQYTPREIVHETNRELKGCWLEPNGQNPLLCVGYDKRLGNESLKASLYSVNKGKLCQSVYNSSRLPHAYCSKLKSLAFCDTRMNGEKKELVVEMLRIGSKGAQKVSQLVIELDRDSPSSFGESPLLNYCSLLKASDLKLMFLDSTDFLMIKESNRIILVNIFTKKILYQKDYAEGVLDINYLKDFRSVMVLTSKRVFLYTINDITHALNEFYSLSITENEASQFTSGRLSIDHNTMLVSLYQENSVDVYRPCFALEIVDSEVRNFSFVVHQAIRYVPVINSKERKICLFGILPWMKTPSSRRDITFDLKSGKLDDGDSYDDLFELKSVIYADSHKTIIQKKVGSGVQKIIFSDSNALMRRMD